MTEQTFEFRPWFVADWSRTALPAGLVLVPVGGYTAYVINQLPETTAAFQWLCIGTAVLVHVLTFGYIGLVVRRMAPANELPDAR